MSVEPYPYGYHLSLCPAEADPPFGSAVEQERAWGRVWGASDEVGPLRSVLVRSPRDEWAVVRGDCYNEQAQALVDPDGQWYWESRDVPDLALVRAQHAGLVDALRARDIDVVFVEGDGPAHLTRPIYTRDPLLTVPGGAVICRMAPAMRRGEEQLVTRAVAAAGMPIIGTIVGSGLVEGGSFAKLAPGVAAYGTSIRCNDEGAEQLRQILAWVGIELIVLPMCGYSIHLDGHLGLVSPELAMVDALGLPYWFLDRLEALGYELLHVPPEEGWAINSLALAPGVVLMCDGYPRTAEMLTRRGVEVITIPYDEIQKGGGGIHCSTMELVRDAAG